MVVGTFLKPKLHLKKNIKNIFKNLFFLRNWAPVLTPWFAPPRADVADVINGWRSIRMHNAIQTCLSPPFGGGGDVVVAKALFEAPEVAMASAEARALLAAVT